MKSVLIGRDAVKALFRLLGCAGVIAMMTISAGPVRADINVNQFEEVAGAAGISYVGASWGSAWGDFDGDGFPDLWLVNHWNQPSLYLNQGDGSFIDIVTQVTSGGIFWGDSHGATWVDFDNDGDQDLYQLTDCLPNGTPIPSLFLVNNGGQLTEEGAAYGLDCPLSRGRMPLWLDFDRDGLLDVLHPNSRRPGSGDDPTALFRQGEAGFTDAAEEAGFDSVEAESWNTAQLADLSGDGMLELLTQQDVFPKKVFNMADEPFEDIKGPIGLASTGYPVDAVVADLDGDLDNDLFVVRGEKAQDFVQLSDFSFEASFRVNDTSELGISFKASGLVLVYVYPEALWNMDEVFIGAGGSHPTYLQFTLSPADSSVWGIFEHVPGVDPGMYIGYEPATETWQVLRSQKTTNLEIRSSGAITELSAVGWDPAELPREDRYMVNLGTGFEDRADSAGFLIPSSGRNVVAADFDNDMDLDLYIVSTGPVENLPNIIYQNQGDGTFVIAPGAGGAAGNSLGRGDAVTVADYNRDGFLDLLVTNGVSKAPFDEDGPTQLFKNLGNANHWIEIDLVGVLSNRDGIGARLLASAGGTVQLREQGGGIHYRGQNHKRIHFGLGNKTQVDVLSILWPSGIIQEINNIPADQIIEVVEPVSTEVQEQDGTPVVARLIGCSPNPFNPTTEIKYSLPVAGTIRLSIHDVTGRLVAMLADGHTEAGSHTIRWNGRNVTGAGAASGVYFIRLEAGGDVLSRKITLIR